MKIVFMGTSTFALPSLVAIHNAGHKILAVVTRPDSPQGRGLNISSPPILEKAKQLGVPILQPEKIKNIEQELASLAPEVIVTVAYGKILPRSILSLPKYGCINLHPSLLPKYRGAAPIEGAIMGGEKETGVTTYFMDEGLDTGDIILQRRIDILSEDNSGTLSERLAEAGADLLLDTLTQIEEGTLTKTPQEHLISHKTPDVPAYLTTNAITQPTYRITTNDSLINWERPAEKIANLVRAFSPKIGAHTFLKGVRIKIWRARSVSIDSSAPPGTIIKVNSNSFIVATRENVLEILELQPENRKRIGAGEFARGARLQEGDCFGS